MSVSVHSSVYASIAEGPSACVVGDNLVGGKSIHSGVDWRRWVGAAGAELRPVPSNAYEICLAVACGALVCPSVFVPANCREVMSS
jgi:hypothetical protein